MNGTIIRKTLRDSWFLLSLLTVSIFVFEVLFMRAMGEYSGEILELWQRRPALRSLVKMLVGADLVADVTATSLVTVGLAHPLLFTLIWTFLLSTCSRVLAGEVERGTADLLLTLPISRTCIYSSVSIVWMLAGIPMCVAPIAGIAVGAQFFPVWKDLELPRLVIPITNLFALYLAVGCGAMLASAFIFRRGMAIGVSLAALLVSFLINFLGQLWKPAENIAFMAILHYYRPLAAVRDRAWPVADFGVLLGVGLLFWLIGMWRFSRQDVPAA